MTYYHLINCLMLTFGPYVVVDRASRLKDDHRYGVYLWSVFAYLTTQLAKMLFAATFLPAGGSGVGATQAVAGGLLSLADGAGVLYILSYRCKGRGKVESVLATGMGWAIAQAVSSHLMPLWMHARATEFTWTSLERGVEANLQLVGALALTALMWLFVRGLSSPVAIVALAVRAAEPAVVAWLVASGSDGLTTLAAKAALTAVTAALAYAAFNYDLVGRGGSSRS
uniref:BOS complex subunit TMEM147 n=1 Tax=Bicosoecida sp. CB-2014 TaxID=1486930 RepID=A0A7S1CN95_9STRA|mmetsp:Transcript_4347/g.15991  ORF Transcript_4347/g.15991 Transcript_4347/m.15991 type:complete len:226 (+) Transcript_4347:60-737(+)